MKKQPIASSPSEIQPETSFDTEEAGGFAALGLSPRQLETVAALGFVEPTPIQARAIPPLLEGRDLVGQARTGTGKTAAFGLPLIAKLTATRAGSAPRGLVLAPTRELALQVTEALKQLATGTPLRFLTVYGGAPYGPQLRGLREGVDVVIGTPGRVIDLMERGSLQFGEVQMVVLDEADEMLEMGFIEAVETILAGTPEDTRQVALFSATMPWGIRKVAERYLKDPVNIGEASQTVVAIEQRYVQVPPRFKREALLKILRSEERGATLVFASTRISCAEAADALAAAGIPAEPLHGDLSQPARERVVELLRARRVEVVVATDIAARGIDIEHLTHIINLDLPKNVEVYTHRIGRTGRAGRSGKAITLVVPREAQRFSEALRRRGVRIEEMFIPSEHELAERQKKAVEAELKALIDDATRAHIVADARSWVAELIESGISPEDAIAGVIALLGEARNLKLGHKLDKGLPPWARQPAAALAEKAAESRPPRERPAPAPRPHAPRPEAAEPQAEGFVVVGIGRNQGVRPADLVGALTNELGLTGRDIGRVEIRDASSVIGVPAAFAARLGEDAWPVTIRRVETTVTRHQGPAPTRRAPHAAPSRARDDRAPAEERPSPRAYRAHTEPEPTRPAPRASHPRAEREAERERPHAPGPRAERSEPTHAASRPARPHAVREPEREVGARPARPYAAPEPAGARPARPHASRPHTPPEPAGARPARPHASRPHTPPEPAGARPARPHAARPHTPSEPAGARPARPHAARSHEAPAAEARRPTKRPSARPSAGDRPPRRAVDVAPRVPRTAR